MTATAEKLEIPGATRPLTYEEYVGSPTETARYDILDGYKVYRLYGKEEMAAPTRQHQRLVRRIARLCEDFTAREKKGECFVAPCDVLIRHIPLKTRQPDVLLLSQERLDQNPPDSDPAPLSPAPELVVEIVSPSERPGQRAAKLSDYHSVSVLEVWQVFAEEKRVDVVALSDDAIETVGSYKSGDTLTSVAFPGLQLAIDTLFEE